MSDLCPGKVINMPAPGYGYLEAVELLSAEDRFRCTVYAMNTLLILKGVYSPEEFERYFLERANIKLRPRSVTENTTSS